MIRALNRFRGSHSTGNGRAEATLEIVLVNLLHVEFFEPAYGGVGCIVHFASGKDIRVTEPLDEIEKRFGINEA